MSVVRGQMWVNPEGVSHVGHAYGEHADTYERHLRTIHMLRVQYKDAWGDDDMGRQFSQKFLAGLDQLEGLVGSVKGTLAYTSEGLTSGGKLYREVDDDARTAGHKMAHDFSNLSVNPGGGPSGGDDGPPATERFTARRLSRPADGSVPGERLLARTEDGTTGELRPMKQARLAERVEGEPTGELKPLLRATRPGEFVGVSLAEPVHELLPTVGTPLTPAIPAISSYLAKPEYATALVDGRPLPEGYRLEALNPFPDGTTRVDANLYDAVAPVVHTPVTDAAGNPLDPEGRQFFLVKDNPLADPTATGYRPMFVSFTADGAAAPLGPGN